MGRFSLKTCYLYLYFVAYRVNNSIGSDSTFATFQASVFALIILFANITGIMSLLLYFLGFGFDRIQIRIACFSLMAILFPLSLWVNRSLESQFKKFKHLSQAELQKYDIVAGVFIVISIALFGIFIAMRL